MLAAAIFALALAVSAGVIVYAIRSATPAPPDPEPLEPLIVRRVSLSLRPTPGAPDQAVIGALIEDRGPVFILRGAVLAVQGQEPAKLDGEILVDRAKVDFVQILPSTEA